MGRSRTKWGGDVWCFTKDMSRYSEQGGLPHKACAHGGRQKSLSLRVSLVKLCLKRCLLGVQTKSHID